MKVSLLQTIRLRQKGLSAAEAFKAGYLAEMLAGDNMAVAFMLSESFAARALEESKPKPAVPSRGDADPGSGGEDDDGAASYEARYVELQTFANKHFSELEAAVAERPEAKAIVEKLRALLTLEVS